jgi:hypothetical protein
MPAMPLHRRLPRPATAWIAAAALVAACGGTIDDNDNGGGSSGTGPTATIATNLVGTASGPLTLFVRFSVDVGSSFTPSDVVVSGGAVRGTSFTQLSASEYRVVVDPAAGTTGTLEVTLPAGSFAAAQGGASNGQAARLSLPYDMRGPASVPDVHITDSTGGGVARSSTIAFTFAFDVDVGDSFVAADIGVSGGTAGTFAKVSATVYTLTVNLPPATRGSVLLTLPAASFVNAGTGETNPRQVQVQASYETP